MSAMSVEPSGGGVGAFVAGLDLNEGIGSEDVSALKEALGEYGVLFFRDQNITPEKHMGIINAT